MERKAKNTERARTAHYTPPRITERGDVEALAQRSEGFVMHEKGRGVVTFDYTTMSIAWGEDPLLFELRGLAFDAASGAIAARPLHKFFDWRERGVDAHTAGPPSEAQTTEKVDGTLVFPAETHAGTVWCTRAGATAHASAAVRSAGADALAAGAALMRPLDPGGEALTPCFEWLGGDPIVVHYAGGPVLRLIAVRERESGRYLEHEALRTAIERAERDTGGSITATLGVRTPWQPPWWPAQPTWKGIEAAVAAAPSGSEGVVVAWPDGLKCKLKSAWYERLHGIHESPWHPRYQLVACIEGDRGEVLTRVRSESVRPGLGAVWDTVQARLKSRAREIETLVDTLETAHGTDQKGFALGLKAAVNDTTLHGIAFRSRSERAQGRTLDIEAEVIASAARQARHERTRDHLLGPQGMLAGVKLLKRE